MGTVTIDDLFELSVPQQPTLSPSGDRLAFVDRRAVDDDTYEAPIVLADLETGSCRQLTHAGAVNSEPAFLPDGSSIVFAAARSDERPQLYLLPTDGGEARRLTSVVGGVGELAVAPDGSAVAFTQSATAAERDAGHDLACDEDYEREAPDPRVIDRTVYRTKGGYFDGRRTHVYVLDLADETVERITDGEDDFSGPAWGDGDTLYFARSAGDDPDDCYDIAICRHRRGADGYDELHTTVGWGRGLTATADGRVAFPQVTPEQGSIQPTELHVLDADTGSVVEVTSGLDRTLGYEVDPAWGPKGRWLYFTTGDEGETALWRARSDGSGDTERVLRRGDMTGFDVAWPDGERVVAAALSEWDHPGDVFVFDGDDPDERWRAGCNDGYLDGVEVREPEQITVDSKAGPVDGWVLTPPAFDPDETYPLVVNVHGGPHIMWTASGTMWHEFQALAAAGYVVFWCNPHGSAGYGADFMQATERDWGDGTLADVLAGTEAVADRPYVDEDAVFLTGGSFGGYMVGWAIGRCDRFSAAVAQRGVYEYNAYFGTTDTGYKSIELDFGTTPWEEHEWLWEQSPAAHAESADTPTLLLHSEDDYRTPLATAEMMYRYLRKTGTTTRLVVYPREGHELSRSGEPAHRIDRLERIVRWFDGYSPYHDAAPVIDDSQP